MSLILRELPTYFFQLATGVHNAHEQMIHQRRQRDIEPFVCLDQKLTVLDLANGRLRPQYRILKAAGHEVYGIDLVNHPVQGWKDGAYYLARILFNWRLPLSSTGSDQRTLVCGDVTALPFPSASFDMVTSVAAFEHFLDVPSVVDGLYRVLRPGGIVWALIHPFTSLSGGHNITLTQVPLRSIPQGIEPWDHLRRRGAPFHVPLNEWRPDQYLKAFTRHFEILSHYCFIREGEAFLAPEIEDELCHYSRDELTCGAYVIVARKPS